MKNIKTLVIKIRITQTESKQLGCEIGNQQGEILHSVPPKYTHENDAIYAALHELATQNNFTGCLKNAEYWINVKDALPPVGKLVEIQLGNQVLKSYLHFSREHETGELSLWWWAVDMDSQKQVKFWRKVAA